MNYISGVLDIFVSGSRDGHVMVWDKRIGRKGQCPNVYLYCMFVYFTVDKPQQL